MAKRKLNDESAYTGDKQSLTPEEQATDTATPENAGASAATDEPQAEEESVMAINEASSDAVQSNQLLSLNIESLEFGPLGDDTLSKEPFLDDPLNETAPNEAKAILAAFNEEKQTLTPTVPLDKIPMPEELQASRLSLMPSERQSFYGLDFNELDRDLSEEERQEWNSIYASYRSRSALTGTIIGVDRHTVNVRNSQNGGMEQQVMYCAIVIPFRVRIVIPATEMWENGQERPTYVLQNMVGAAIDFIIIKVDREGGFAIASRRLAARVRRYYFSRRPALNAPISRVKCRVLSVGPRRCLVECYGHDVSLTQRELRYTSIPDLRTEYHPGEELDCIVKAYDAASDKLIISVKETKSNPFEGAELRHPIGSRRQAVIAGKYGGGVFCNLPDGTVCMCAYSFQYDDSQFQIGDTVIVAISRYDMSKKQIYGKIISKW